MADEIIIKDEDITQNPLAEKGKEKKWKQVLLLVSEVLKAEVKKGKLNQNLIAHLRDVHQIIDEDENVNNPKRLRNTKITDFARSYQPHPKHNQKQPYKEKISHFDPSFVVPVQIERTKNDGSKLRKISLSEEEWDLLDELVDHLLPFEEATREFSGGTCVTFSKMMPNINELIFDLEF
ncbi:11784_t:CDS:2 [Rhizophagus irregularis]|nr:11784_t:CDS:2 [Rhizophagus irregularis]